MAISSNGLQLVRIAGAVFNQQLSASDYTEILAANKTAAELDAWANAAVAAEFRNKTTTDIAKAVLTNVGLTSVVGLENWVVGQLNAGGGVAKAGQTMLAMLNDYSNMSTTEAIYGASVATFNAKAANSQVLSQTAGTAGGTYAAVPTVVAVKPSTFTLTIGTDAPAATGGNDTFDASLTPTALQTLTATDNLDGGAGEDILIGTINSSVTPQSIKNIETIQLGVATNASTLDLTNATGIKTVVVAGSTAAATLAGISKATAVTLRDSTQAHTVIFNDVSGSADEATINIANVTGAPVLTIANVETLSYNSTGASANSVGSTSSSGSNTLTGATKLNVTGTTAINVGTLTAVKTLDGSKHAPTDNVGITATFSASAVTVMGGSGNDSITVSSTGTDNLSGGAGNDTFVFSTAGGLALTDTIDGGANTDTLRATAADLAGISGSTPATYNITNVETLQVLDSFTGTLRAPNISTSANRVNLAPITATTVGTGTIVGPAGAFTVNLGGSTSGVTYVTNNLTGGLTVTASGTAATDTLTVTNTAVTSSAGGTALNVYNGNAIAINGYETVTLSTGAVGGAANTISTLTVTADLGGKANVSLTGANALTFSGIVTADSLDASALSGAISMAAVANTATTVTGGIGGDALRGNAALPNSITGNAGDDSIFGGAGNDTLAGGDGADTITAGSGNDNISGGSGNDVIIMAGNLTSADVIDGGDGVDTLTISSALGTTGTPNFTSIELLGLSANGVTQDMNAFTGTGLTQVLIDGTGNSITNAASNLTTLNVAATASTGTLTFARLINTTNDSVTVNFASATTTLANGTSFAAEENITIGRYGSTSGTGVNVTFTTPTLTAMKTLTLNGEHNYAIGSNGATAFATLNASTATGTVSVDASASTVAFTATVSGAAAVTLTGGSGADVLPGTAFADSLTGGDGADSITAGAGDDFVSGGRGADTLVGGDGTDTVDFSGIGAVFDLGGAVAASGVAVNLSSASITTATVTTNHGLTSGSVAAALSAGLSVLPSGQAAYLGAVANGVSIVSAVVDTLSGFENVTGSATADLIVGSSAANTLSGLAGADYIDGGAGDDSIVGGAGLDYLVGGAGNDRFDFTTDLDATTGGQITVTNAATGLAIAATDTISTLVMDQLVVTAGDTLFLGSALNVTLDPGIGNVNTADGAVGTITLAGAAQVGYMYGSVTGSTFTVAASGTAMMVFWDGDGNDTTPENYVVLTGITFGTPTLALGVLTIV